MNAPDGDPSVVDVLVELLVLVDVLVVLLDVVLELVDVVVVVEESAAITLSRQLWTSAWIVGLCPHAPAPSSDAWRPLSHRGWHVASRPGWRTSFDAHRSSHPPAFASALTDVA